MNSEDILFLLYTSGSTGKPKGIVHTQAGYLLYAACTHQVCICIDLTVYVKCDVCQLSAVRGIVNAECDGHS